MFNYSFHKHAPQGFLVRVKIIAFVLEQTSDCFNGYNSLHLNELALEFLI